ncbi:MAG: bifunctional UDP-N-acetylglucosamine diphosphorylase/glucosamine-1-phosphate N-acetyltransferase GlmU [Actinomycetes bacterium]
MSAEQTAVIVLAAGAGTRMNSAKPKVMHELAGVPLLGHALATASKIGADQVICVVRHQKELLVDFIEANYPNVVVAEQDELAGTGRAVECGLAALPKGFAGKVVVTSGDVPMLDVETLGELISSHSELGNAATLLTTYLDDPSGYGRIVRNEFDLVGIVEHRDATEDQLDIDEVNAGVYVFDSALLASELAKVGTSNSQHEKYLTDVVAQLIQQGHPVEALSTFDHWLVAGINDRSQLAKVAAELNRRLCEAWQLAGVTIVDPSTTWLDVTVSIGEDVTIWPSTYLQGETVIHSGATIGPEVVLNNVEIGVGATIIKSHATSSRIGDGASVGPFAFLRAGTDLGANGKIGTFVETKNAVIGEGSKVPHLSYVGDAEIGTDSNIGAGTIFANYDGVNKHHSKIGSGVRSGSHNVFVAPVTIGDGAYTAAGTVVRKDVEPGELGMTVAPQRNLADWVLQNRAGTEAAKAAESGKGKN